MKSIGTIVFILIALSACAGNIRTTIKMPDTKKLYEVSSKSDALVTIVRDGVTVTVDNRGRPGFFEQLLGADLPDRLPARPTS